LLQLALPNFSSFPVHSFPRTSIQIENSLLPRVSPLSRPFALTGLVGIMLLAGLLVTQRIG
jgi:hypothetical protein